MDKRFPILAVETTGDLCSVAILKSETEYVEINHLEKHIHSQKIMGMIDYVVKQLSISTRDINCIAISMGPGSYTGLRIGMAAIKGIAFGSNLGIIPVPTFDAHALQLSSILPGGTKFNIIIKASIDDVYFAKFNSISKSVETVHSLSLIERGKIESLIRSDEQNFGNVALDNFTVNNNLLYSSSIGWWAYLFGKDLLTFDYDNLEPNYLKQFIGKVKS
jgi:tRNA threonylcarbamoyladenosine biosynthesis protein TsaB